MNNVSFSRGRTHQYDDGFPDVAVVPRTDVQVRRGRYYRMDRRHFVAAAGALSLAGCTGLFSERENSRLDLAVRNERPDPVTVQVDVVADDGTTYEDASDQVDSGVARAFEVVVGTAGRHTVTVTGEDFRGELAWNADTCRLFDGTVRVTDGALEVIGECVDPR